MCGATGIGRIPDEALGAGACEGLRCKCADAAGNRSTKSQGKPDWVPNPDAIGYFSNGQRWETQWEPLENRWEFT